MITWTLSAKNHVPNTGLQSQKAVSAYLLSKQILLFGFARQTADTTTDYCTKILVHIAKRMMEHYGTSWNIQGFCFTVLHQNYWRHDVSHEDIVINKYFLTNIFIYKNFVKIHSRRRTFDRCWFRVSPPSMRLTNLEPSWFCVLCLPY